MILFTAVLLLWIYAIGCGAAWSALRRAGISKPRAWRLMLKWPVLSERVSNE